MFSQETARIREQEELVAYIELQIDKEFSEIAGLKSQLQKEITEERQRKSQFSATEPGSIEDEERAAAKLRYERDALQEKIVLYIKENFDEATVLQAKKELQAKNAEITNKHSLIRGLQGKEPLSSDPAALQNHRKGRFYAQGLPNLKRRQAAIESPLSKRMQEVSKLRATKALETASLEKQVRALEASVKGLAQLKISADAFISEEFALGLNKLLRRWKSSELDPPEDGAVEYFERKNIQRGISRTWLMKDLEERGFDGKSMIGKFKLFFSEDLSDEVSGEILVLARREFGDFFEDVVDHLRRA